MKLNDLIHRSPCPVAWQEGDNIPWSEPGFSSRMLREHLTQEHDAASRREALIDRHVSWIHGAVLNSRRSRVLDLGCGPGLYSARLAQLGHSCTGIDYSPASIAYARKFASDGELACTYVEQDLRDADFGSSEYDLAMLLYGEFNIFRPAHIRQIMKKAGRALADGGQLLLEPHTFNAVRKIGEEANTWYTAQSGLFSETAHLLLTENHWNPTDRTATVRHFLAGGDSCDIMPYAQSFQAYTDEEYTSLLKDCGFDDAKIWPALGDVVAFSGNLMAITATKNDFAG